MTQCIQHNMQLQTVPVNINRATTFPQNYLIWWTNLELKFLNNKRFFIYSWKWKNHISIFRSMTFVCARNFRKKFWKEFDVN